METYQNLYLIGCCLIPHLYPLNRIQNSRQVLQVTLHPVPTRHFVLFHFLSLLDLPLTLLILRLQSLFILRLQFLLLLVILLQVRSLHRTQILTHFLLTLTLNHLVENQFEQVITQHPLPILLYILLLIHSVLILVDLTALHQFNFILLLPTSLPPILIQTPHL